MTSNADDNNFLCHKPNLNEKNLPPKNIKTKTEVFISQFLLPCYINFLHFHSCPDLSHWPMEWSTYKDANLFLHYLPHSLLGVALQNIHTASSTSF